MPDPAVPADCTDCTDSTDTAVLAAEEELRGRRVLVTGGRGFLGRHLVRRRTLARHCDYTGPFGFGEMDDRSHDVAQIADPDPARRLLGWRPRTPLVGGLSRTARWYSKLPRGTRDEGRAAS